MNNDNLDQLKIELEKQLNQLNNSPVILNQDSKEIEQKKEKPNLDKNQLNSKTKEKSIEKNPKNYLRNFLYLTDIILFFLLFLWGFRRWKSSGDWILLFLIYNLNLYLWQTSKMYKKKKRSKKTIVKKKLSNNIHLFFKEMTKFK